MTGMPVAPDDRVGMPVSRDPAIETSRSMDGLAAIGEAHVELALWRRALPAALTAWVEALDPDVLPHLRVLVTPGEAPAVLEPILDAGGTPAGAMRDLLVQDIADLVAAYAGIARTDLVDLRLERIEHDACWRFHRDCVAARLLTTYRGPATEYVRPRDADRALRDQRDYDGPLERMGTDDVALFKGSCSGNGSGIVHRSPPIEGTGAARLLLCLNTPSAASPGLDEKRP